MLAILALSAACSGAGGSGPGQPEQGLRIWVAPLVHWDAGADRHLDVAIENGTTRTLALAEPDPSNARVSVFPGPDNLRTCGVDFRPGTAGERRRVEIPPGGAVTFRVDLEEACADMPAGEYRFELDYRSPPIEGGKAFSGGLATRYGELVVQGEAATAGAKAHRQQTPRSGRALGRRGPPRSAE